MILPDNEIKRLGIVDPFMDECVSSYGYDLRCGYEFVTYRNSIKPISHKKADEEQVSRVIRDTFILNPGCLALTHSMEFLRIPRNILALCIGKSSYARCGVLVNATPLEPEWYGQVTLELSNVSASPVIIYGGEGIAQVVFMRADIECSISYADKNGKYQGQAGVTLPKC
jgi:dCTP deaminase